MRLKHYILSVMAMITMATSIQQPLLAEKKHSSSSTSHKDDKCCKKSKKLLKQINQTTMQDLVVDQNTLGIVSQINQTTRADLAVDQETLDIVKHLQNCSCTCTVIMPQDFEDEEGNLTQTYFITEPGSYCLGGDVAFFPLDEFTPAINILANDVRLDLRGFTLSQANDTPNAYGVQIGQGYNYDDPDAVLKNITVLNGSIIDFTAIGVFCYNGSFDEPTAELAFEDLHFSDLNILDCGSSPSFDYASGINLDSFADIPSTFVTPTDPVAYSGVIIKNCNVNGCVGSGAVNIYTFDDLLIENTQANDLSTSVQGISLCFAYDLIGRNLQMSDCQGNGVQDLDPEFTQSQCGGIYLVQSLNSYVKDCQFNDFFGESEAIVNNNLSNCNNAVFENCQFNNARGGTTAVAVAGVHMSDIPGQTAAADGMKFINCQFNGATVSSDNEEGGYGFYASGFTAITLKNIIFENCQACNISAEGTGFGAWGFLLECDPSSPEFPFGNVQNITFSNCVVSDVTGGNASVAMGIWLASSNFSNFTPNQSALTNMVVQDCVVERIFSPATLELYSELRVAGIAETLDPVPGGSATPFQSLRNLYVNNCRVSDVRNSSDDPTERSAGILVESVQNPVIVNNSVSDCDRGILLTGTNDITPNGFQLALTPEDATLFTPIPVNLTTIPTAAPLQNFNNNLHGNVSIAPSSTTINTIVDLILPTTDLTALGWESGDPIVYDCNGGNPISNLVCGTTYYAIVYIPGFSRNGLIQNNEVDNCSISCYQDDAPTTTSAWVNNTAFNCGGVCPDSCPTQFTNYDINFAGVRPVDPGTLTAYPVGGNKYYNLSLVP